ncbi:DNA polymerase III subunit alpha [Alicyclobacillus tolerans]|nr:DNA polymerase III subunit alpha [Alicyclobacillus tolerans]
MSVPEFVHLHVHSEYSLLQGALRIGDAVAAAVRMGMSALAITDTHALYGAVSFYRQAKAAGIKPIVGVQLTVAKDEDNGELTSRRPNHPGVDTAVLLAEDYTGYQNLVKLVTLAHERMRYPFVTFSELRSHCRGLFALIGGGESKVLELFSANQGAEAQTWLQQWLDAWPSTHLYVDVQDHGLVEERRGLPALVKWARDKQIPLAATNDAHYLNPEDADVQRVLAQIEGGSEVKLLKGDRYTLASPEEMARRFSKLPEAVENAVLLAERCNLELPLGQTLLPKYPTPHGEPSSEVLRRAAEAGAVQRYGQITAAVRERLDYELQIINGLDFADYFLVVADFIRFAHRSKISTGPGRGSAAGSLVAYALRITDVDPLRHRLLFERFLNPERVSWPDIDTDFEYERRGEVIQYVVERYGREHVAQIGTFGTLAARAAIRDAGRVLQIDAKLVDRLAKLIPSYPGVTLERAQKETPGIRDLLDTNPDLKRLWQTAQGLEGFPRHTSIHAAGVVISPIELSQLVPVQPGSDGTPVTQFAMEDIERLGLIKMDFLGLRTLTLIDHCVASIERRHRRKFDWKAVSETDRKTFEMLSKGETNGCFQLESNGVKRVLQNLRPSSFEDIIAVISLYRPGPMENIPVFIAAKHGKTAIHYPHPDLEPILKDTYGVIVYQEQIMQIASRMAGFTLGQADLLRRAVSKKKREELDSQRSQFVEGGVEHGYSPDTANDVYDLIVRFADYGFNRSHAAAYAVLAYRTAYLRANYLPDFFAALLTMVMADSQKVGEYVRDAKKHRVDVLGPSVVHSEAVFTVEGETAIRTGLMAVRNVGKSAVEAVFTARADRPFGSLVDFLERVNNRACNRKAVESLLAAGALDEFLPDNASSEAKLSILNEAYLAADEGRQAQGLGLSWQGGLGLGEATGPSVRDSLPATAATSAAQAGPLVLYIRLRDPAAAVLRQVKQVLGQHPGEVKVALYDTKRRKLRLLGEPWGVAVSPELIALAEEVVGLGNVRLGRLPKQTGTGLH